MITALDAPLPDVPTSLSVLKEVEEAADALDLPLTGEEWGERLAIKKRAAACTSTMASARARRRRTQGRRRCSRR